MFRVPVKLKTISQNSDLSHSLATCLGQRPTHLELSAVRRVFTLVERLQQLVSIVEKRI